MLSEYRNLLEKRRLERKRGHNPVPELPPFVPLPKDELAQMPPSSPASFDYEPYFSREPITLSRRSPSVYSRQSINASPPPSARSRNIITPPPLALSIADAMESDQRSSPQRPSYLSQLAPFSVTPRKRLFAETTMITIEESATTDEDEAHRNKRVQSPSITREAEHREYPEQSPIDTPAAEDQASIPETEHANNNGDIDMVDANTHNKIPNNEQPPSPVVEENDITESLSIHDLSIHEENHNEDEAYSTPPAIAKSPKRSNNNVHHTSVSIEPQEQNESQQLAAKGSSQEPNEPQKQMPGDDAEKSTEAQNEAPGSVELQESVLQENVEKSAKSTYQTVVEEITQENLGELQQKASESIEAETSKMTDQAIINGHVPETENSVDPATKGDPIKYGFDDGDDIDYGGYDDANQENEGKPADNMSQVEGQTSQAEEDTPNDVLRDLRTMATANTVNLRKIRKMSNLHIQTISNLVLDSTKEARNNTADAHEKSIIEDYYYTVNDDLKKCHKQYLQYQQCASANRRLKAYHRKKDLQFLNVIKEEGTLKRRIHDLRQEIDEVDSRQDTWTRIEALFHDINQIKGSSISTVTKQV